MMVVRTQGPGRDIQTSRIATPTLGKVTLRKAQESVNTAQNVGVGTVPGRLDVYVMSRGKCQLIGDRTWNAVSTCCGLR